MPVRRPSANTALRNNWRRTARFVDVLPPAMQGRPLGLRGFDDTGMLVAARLASPGDAETQIRDLLDQSGIAYLDAHNAAHGCFVARVHPG